MVLSKEQLDLTYMFTKYKRQNKCFYIISVEYKKVRNVELNPVVITSSMVEPQKVARLTIRITLPL